MGSRPLVAFVGLAVAISACRLVGSHVTSRPEAEGPPRTNDLPRRFSSLARGPYFACGTYQVEATTIASCVGHSVDGDMPWSPVRQRNVVVERPVANGAAFIQGSGVICLVTTSLGVAECWSGAWGDHDATDASSLASSYIIELGDGASATSHPVVFTSSNAAYPCIAVESQVSIRVACAEGAGAATFHRTIGNPARLVAQPDSGTLCMVFDDEAECTSAYPTPDVPRLTFFRMHVNPTRGGVVSFDGGFFVIDLAEHAVSFVNTSERAVDENVCSHDSISNAVLFARVDTALVWVTSDGTTCGIGPESCRVTCVDTARLNAHAASALANRAVYFGVSDGDECVITSEKPACWSLNDDLSRSREVTDLSRIFQRVERAVRTN